MVRSMLVLATCVCALATYALGQQPAKQVTVKDADAAMKAISDLIDKWSPKLLERRSVVRKIGNGHDKIERYLLVFDDIQRDLTETKLNLYLLSEIEPDQKRAGAIRVVAGVMHKRLMDYDQRCAAMESMWLKFRHPEDGTVPPVEKESDPLLDTIEHVRAMRKELEPHVQTLQQLRIPKPATGGRLG